MGVIHSGLNCDGDKVIVQYSKDKGMIVKTNHTSKPKWYEVVEYDENGFQESISYESA